MLYVAQTALELGFQYALVAMALFLSYRVLDIADLTTDGCFVLGCAVSVTLTAAGHPFLAIPAAMLAGACAGFVTAFLQTKLGVPSILAGHRRQPGHGALLLHQPQFHHHHRPVRGQRPHRPVRRSSGPGPEDS